MKTMIAKYPGTCVACGESIKRGESINYFGRHQGAAHVSCGLPGENNSAGNEAEHEYQDGEVSPSTLAIDRALARRGLSVVRFSSGNVMTQNSRGRCEDAPCCGCCS